jgi:hypothetical protein
MPTDCSPFDGPSPWNDAAARIPHVNPRTFRVFSPVNPSNVIDNWRDYLTAVAFIPALFVWFFLLYAIGQWVSECYRGCGCCKTERERCECKCCPKRCCQPLTLNRSHPQADVIAPVAIFGFLGFAGAIITIVFIGMAQWSVDDAISVFRHLDDIQQADIALLQQAVDQMNTNAAGLITLINDSQSAGVPPSEVLLIQDALYGYVQPATDSLTNALETSDVDLGITSVANSAHSGVVWMIVAGSLFFTLIVLVELASYLGAFLKPRPVNPIAAFVSSYHAAILLVLGLFLVAPMMDVSIVAGDLCQDPKGYILEKANKTASDFVDFYVNCPPGKESPVASDLNSARNATVAAYGLVTQYGDYLQLNGTYPVTLYNQTQVIASGLNTSIAQIDTLNAISGCGPYNCILNHGLNDACGSAFKYNFVWIYSMWICLIFLLIKSCFVPRAEDPGYVSVRDDGAAAGDEETT